MEQRYTSNEVIALTGITARQLQWWDERGLVVPLKQGHRRLYSLDDVAEMAVICDLRRRGFSLQRVRMVIRFLQKEFGKRLVQTVSAGSDYHLLTDGKRLFLETSPQQVIDVLKNSRQAMFTICLSDTVRQVRAELQDVKSGAAQNPRPPAREKKSVRSDSGVRRLRARRVS
ncbi:MAG TPA: MerR family transcriptional regulator [Terriglobales bacterium]|jgi:DNA-binding transcriptional MerR regulator|nr:MerR family transcriptional regulator [Terriglobales bacterium]